MFPVERNRHGHPLAGLLWEGKLEGNSLNRRVGESTQLGVSFFFDQLNFSYQYMSKTCKWPDAKPVKTRWGLKHEENA